MNQGWRRSEVGNHKRCTLNTRLPSVTSEHTSSSSRNVPGTMIRADLFWYWNKIKMKPNLGQYFRINFSEVHLRPTVIYGWVTLENEDTRFSKLWPRRFQQAGTGLGLICQIARSTSSKQCTKVAGMSMLKRTTMEYGAHLSTRQSRITPLSRSVLSSA